MNNIALCGFMGCGKTTVGTELAGLLGYTFIDMDAYIEVRAGLPVARIFELYGEEHFRNLETETLRELSAQRRLVISTGGGVVLRPENVALLKAGGKIVFIEVPLCIIRRRLEGDTARPLLNRPDRDEAMAALYAARLPAYRAAADFTVINDDDRRASLVAAEIARFFRSDNG